MFNTRELEKINALLNSGKLCGWWNSPKGGLYLQHFEETFAKYIGVKHAIAVSSGTVSIYVALRACGIERGDVVAVSPYTHIGSVAPILLIGAEPLFVDVDWYGNISCLNIDGASSKDYMAMKAVIAVHQLGRPCEMDGFKFYGKPIIEDCAQALGTEYRGQKVGSIGDVGCFSIGGDMTKTITTGEGGMLTTNSDEIAEKCRAIRNHGEKSGHNFLCFNFRISELQALVGLLQMDGVKFQNDWQIGNAEHLIRNLPPFLKVPKTRTHCKPVHYIVGCYFNTNKINLTRDAFLQCLKEKGVEGGLPRKNISGGYSKLIYELPMYNRYARRCPVAERKRDESIWIDWHRHPRTRGEIDKLLAVMREFE